MSGVDIDSMRFHGFSDLIDDALLSCFDAQTLLYFCDVVGEGLACVNSWSVEHFFESESFSIDDMFVLIFLGDKCAVDAGDASYDYIAQFSPERFEFEHQVGLADWNNVDTADGSDF